MPLQLAGYVLSCMARCLFLFSFPSLLQKGFFTCPHLMAEKGIRSCSRRGSLVVVRWMVYYATHNLVSVFAP
jgi:hypothetical protein